MAVKFFGRKNAPFLAIFVGVTGAGGRIGGVGCTLVGNVSKEKGTKILVHFSHSLIRNVLPSRNSLFLRVVFSQEKCSVLIFHHS